MFILTVFICKPKKANCSYYSKQFWGFQKVIKKFMYLHGNMNKLTHL